MANIQQELVQSEPNVNIAELQAKAEIQRANGEAESSKHKAVGNADAIRATGTAQADTYRSGVEALGAKSYTAMQIMQIIGDRHVRLIPDILVGGGGDGKSDVSTSGVVDDLLSMTLWNQTAAGKGADNNLVPRVVTAPLVGANLGNLSGDLSQDDPVEPVRPEE